MDLPAPGWEGADEASGKKDGCPEAASWPGRLSVVLALQADDHAQELELVRLMELGYVVGVGGA